MPYTINQLKTPGLTIHANKVAWLIASRIRDFSGYNDVAFIAYLFYKLLNSRDKKLNSPYSLEETANMQLERFRTGEIMLNPYVLNSINGRVRRGFIRAYKVYEDVGDNDDVYAAIVEFFEDIFGTRGSRMDIDSSTPDSLVRLAQSILDIRNEDRVADICCGNGNFITKSIEIKPKASYSGYERSIACAAILAMKADILGVNPEVYMGDIEYTLSYKEIKFDKIFSNYPINMRLDNYENIMFTMPFYISRFSGDWYFNNVVIDHLSKNGKAVVISSVGSTWNITGRDARRYFIENGYIEAVINLPGGILSGTSVPIVAYVFSHGNESIRIVNAEDVVNDTDKYNRTLSDENIKEILKMLQNDSEKSIQIPKEDVIAKDYSLAFKTYHSGLPKYKNGTKISEVATIIRGTLNPRGNMSNEVSGKYLLQISDLEGGTIKKDLSEGRFVKVEKDISEQRLLPYDLVISRNAQPVKIAIVSPDEKRELYPNGNMFIVRVNNPKVNPYYLLAFLMSKDGQEALSFASTGNLVKIISASSLAELVFPLKESKKQRKIAEKVSDSMALYMMHLKRANIEKDKIENAFYGEED